MPLMHRLREYTFQSTLPRGERRTTRRRQATIISCFNPRSRAGSDSRMQMHRDCAACVSIHAPARGATFTRPRHATIILFQSTLPRGERPATRSATDDLGTGFNPRSRAGSDVHRCKSLERVHAVSIHAPARGATVQVDPCVPRCHEFQSTLPRGERRLCNATCISIIDEFQSTLPRGERRLSRHGRARRALVSIHAPARGATRLTISVSNLAMMFQSTLPRGERHRCQLCSMARTTSFNPRSRAGSDAVDRRT